MTKIILLSAVLASLISLSYPHVSDSFAKTSSAFGLTLYVNAIESLDENVVLSPISVQSATAMLFMGARGKTAEQLDTGLFLEGQDREHVAEIFKGLLGHHEHCPFLQMANKIYVSSKYSVKPEFLDVVSKNFFSTAENIDFNDESAVEIINSWVKEKTDGAIHDIIKTNDISSLTASVIVNAIHFKAQWKHGFSAEKTKKESFHTQDGHTVEVDMMNLEQQFGFDFVQELGASVIDLPYKDSDISMFIILPDEGHFKEVGEKLESTNILELMKRERGSVRVNLKLPKFKIEYSTELSDAFKKMGMTDIFEEPDLKDMSDEKVSVEKIVHKAFLEVNEEGTEAAAGSGIITILKTGSLEFHANRPFYFIIKGSSGEVYFMGQYVKPE